MLTNYIRVVDKFIYPLIWCSIILLFVEMATGSTSSKEGWTWFLYIERFSAFVFFLEYVARLIEDRLNPDGHMDFGHSYPLSIMGIIDLCSFLPFLVGFFLPTHLLGWVRALRVLRCFKLFRYSRKLQLYALAMYKAWPLLQPILLTIFVFGLLSSALLYEAEKNIQPEFGDVFTLFYFVATSDSTVGYGDISPVTTIGRTLTIFLIFIPGIAVFSSLTGIMSASLSEVMELERDPNVDPIEEFLKERNKHV